MKLVAFLASHREDISLAIDAANLLLSLALFIVAAWGLRTWRAQLIIENKLQWQAAARRVALAADDLITEIHLLRSGKTPRAWLREGKDHLHQSFLYQPPPMNFQVALIDRLIANLLDAVSEARYTLRASPLSAAHPFVSTAKKFRDALANSSYPASHHPGGCAQPHRPIHAQAVPQIEFLPIISIPADGPDCFGSQLLRDHEMLITALRSIFANPDIDDKEFLKRIRELSPNQVK